MSREFEDDFEEIIVNKKSKAASEPVIEEEADPAEELLEEEELEEEEYEDDEEESEEEDDSEEEEYEDDEEEYEDEDESEEEYEDEEEYEEEYEDEDEYDIEEEIRREAAEMKRQKKQAKKDKKAKKKARKKKKHTVLKLLLVIILLIGGVVGAKYYANSQGLRLRQLIPFEIPYLDTLDSKIEELRKLPFLKNVPFLNQLYLEETEAPTEPVVVETEPVTEAPTEPADVDLTKDGNPAITALVNDYYAARLAGDTEALSKILVDGVEMKSDQLDSEKEFVEGYSDIAAYVTDGMKTGEYAVYISYYQKFANIATAAPGLAPCYVTTDNAGKLRMAFYNSWDNETKAFMNKISGMPSVEMLASDVDSNFQAAKESDYDLRVFMAALVGETAPAEQNAESPAESSAAAATETTAQALTDENGQKIEFKEVDDIQYTTTSVRCRKTPSLEETADYTMLELGTWVHVVGVSDKWCKVILRDGHSGYVYKEFLSPEKPETTAAAGE